MTDNLAIWSALERTDPKHVKPITGKTYQGNSPRPQYVIWKLTERFGPVGFGFGWEVKHDGYIDGIPHQDGTEKLHECRIRFWWGGPHDEQEAIGSIESYGCTKALYKAGTKGGQPGYWVSDEDAAKKSLTDAIVKAASWLGVAGDIFMGRWDDSKYQAELREEFSKARAFPKTTSDHPKDEPRTAAQRPAEPPHDPETGEVYDDRNPPPQGERIDPTDLEVNDSTPGEWVQMARDKLGLDGGRLSAGEKRRVAEEYSRMLVEKAGKYKPSERALVWINTVEVSHQAYIEKLDDDLKNRVRDALAEARDRATNPMHDPADYAPIGVKQEPVILGDVRVA